MGFDKLTIISVWKKGTTVTGNDPKVWKKDECGAWIRFDKYGDRNSTYGWEIDHIVSVENGGTDKPSNLRPLQWENNVSKSSGRLKCAVTAKGDTNGPA